jgi:hypothetical protein
MLGAAFWLVHAAIAVQHVPSWPVKVLAVGHAVLFVALAGLAVGAWRTMHRHPPPAGHEVLPADYKVPYSHLHADPPEVRLAQELAQRRQRLAHEQAELQQLEEKLREASRQNPGREP